MKICNYCYFSYICKHADNNREGCKYGDNLSSKNLKEEILKENGHSLPLQK